MANTRVVWDKHALGRYIGMCPEAHEAVTEAVERIAATANSIAEDPTGGRYGGYPDGGILTHPQQPEYDCQVLPGPSRLSWIGFVHPANGAGYADVAKNNTLLKALGG